MLRVDFVDAVGEPISIPELSGMCQSVSRFYRNISLGKLELLFEYFPQTVRVGSTLGSYTNKENQLYVDALIASGVSDVNYDFVGVCFYNGVFAAAGKGAINGKRFWIATEYSPPGTIAHELGHCLGLHHARALRSSGPLADGPKVEYGDPLDIMGAADLGEGNISGLSRFRLGWLTPESGLLITNDTRFLLPKSPTNGQQSVVRLSLQGYPELWGERANGRRTGLAFRTAESDGGTLLRNFGGEEAYPYHPYDSHILPSFKYFWFNSSNSVFSVLHSNGDLECVLSLSNDSPQEIAPFNFNVSGDSARSPLSLTFSSDPPANAFKFASLDQSNELIEGGTFSFLGGGHKKLQITITDGEGSLKSFERSLTLDDPLLEWQSFAFPERSSGRFSISSFNGALMFLGEKAVWCSTNNGRSWNISFTNSGTPEFVRTIGNNLYVGLNYSTNRGEIWKSKDGDSWTLEAAFTNPVRDFASTGSLKGVVLGLCDGPNFAISAQGGEWKLSQIESCAQLPLIGAYGSLFTSAFPGRFYATTNGVDWQRLPEIETTSRLWLVGETLFAGGNDLLFSTNGFEWSIAEFPLIPDRLDVTQPVYAANAFFIAVSAFQRGRVVSFLLTSKDKKKWVHLEKQIDGYFRQLLSDGLRLYGQTFDGGSRSLPFGFKRSVLSISMNGPDVLIGWNQPQTGVTLNEVTALDSHREALPISNQTTIRLQRVGTQRFFRTEHRSD